MTSPDYYNSPEECLQKSNERKQTNPRYKNFTQEHFTAGDEEQFYESIGRNVKEVNFQLSNIELDKNKFKFHTISSYEYYKNIGVIGVDNTFRYLFYKLKKGIYFRIENNELVSFVPFSNANFRNEWSHMIKHDPEKYDSIISFLEYVNKLDCRNFNKYRVNKDKSLWYGNNCLIRYEFPINEGDTNVGAIRDMLITLCKERKVPDIELFINKRDFPVLKKNGTEPYDHIWNNSNKKLESHLYDKYSPILSMSSDVNEYADILMPTHEDWVRVMGKEKKFFAKALRPYDTDFNIAWKHKKCIAVFRGSSTGAGVTIDSNLRLKVSYMSSQKIKDDDGMPFLDAGITSWCLRPRKLYGKEYLTTIEKDDLPFGLVNKLSPYEQSSYKYIIHLDGHVSAFRLSLELAMGSVLLIPKSKWSIWYSQYLEPYVHYVPVDAELDNLYEQIRWCKENDDECEKIASNAKEFYERYLCKDGILDFLQKTLIETKKLIGFTYYNKYDLYQYWDFEKELIFNDYLSDIQESLTFKNKIDIKSIINRFDFSENLEYKHTFGYCKFIDEFIRYMSNESLSKNKNVLFTSVRTQLDLVNLNGYKFTLKTKKGDEFKDREIEHEYFVGRIVNDLLTKIPNFRYTFQRKQNSNFLLTEYISGKTLFEFLASSEFNMLTFLDILSQIALALHVAQDTCVFIHKDLAPWNIILLENVYKTSYDYCLNTNIIYTCNMKYTPVLIDYGRSHVTFKNIHFENGNMSDRRINNILNPNAAIDIVSILLTSIDIIVKTQCINKKLYRNEIQQLINLVNFLSRTNLLKEPINSLQEMKSFVSHYKKYGILTGIDLSDIRDFTPLELVKHIYTNVDGRVHVSQKQKETASLNLDCHSVHVMLYTLSKTKEQKRQSFEIYKYLDIRANEKSNDKLTLFDLYKTIKINNILKHTKKYYNEFLKNNYSNVDQRQYLTDYDRNVEKYKTINYKQRLEINETHFIEIKNILNNVCLPVFYTINDYTVELDMKQISEILKMLETKKEHVSKFDDTTDFLDIIEYINTYLELDLEIENKFTEILRFRPFAVKQFFASTKTIFRYVEKVKSFNVDILECIIKKCLNDELKLNIKSELELYKI